MHKNTTSPLSGWQWPGMPTMREARDNRAELPFGTAADLATGMAPAVISTRVNMCSDLVGDTGIEPVTSSV
jgi:hypothetical protein